MHHQFVHFIDPKKPVPGLMNNFVHFIHPYMNPLPELGRVPIQTVTSDSLYEI